MPQPMLIFKCPQKLVLTLFSCIGLQGAKFIWILRVNGLKREVQASTLRFYNFAKKPLFICSVFENALLMNFNLLVDRSILVLFYYEYVKSTESKKHQLTPDLIEELVKYLDYLINKRTAKK